MAKINPRAYTRPEREKYTFDLTDPAHPEIQHTITLRAPDAVDQHRIAQTAQDLTLEYLGYPELNIQPTGEGYDPPDFGEPITITENLLEGIARILVMQCPEHDIDRYNDIELLDMAVTLPNVYATIYNYCDKVRAMAKGDDRVNPTEPEGSDSSPSASGTTSDTQPSNSDKTSCSEASTTE